MALVSGRSALNPNAPLFVPAAVRQVEDFSAEWWQLITTATWFREYWMNQRQGEDGLFDGGDEIGDGDVVDLLPDALDLDPDEDLLEVEAQFEEFIHSSEGNKSIQFDLEETRENGVLKDAKILIKSLTPLTDKARRTLVNHAKHWEKPVKNISPKCSPRCIQQPRRM